MKVGSAEPSLIFNWDTKWPLSRFFQETILLKTMARVLIEEKRMRYGNDERMRYGVNDAQNGDNVP